MELKILHTSLLCCIVKSKRGDVRCVTSTCRLQIFTDLIKEYISSTFRADSSWPNPTKRLGNCNEIKCNIISLQMFLFMKKAFITTLHYKM